MPKVKREKTMFDFLDTPNKKKRITYTYIVFLFNGMLALSIGSLMPFIREAKMIDYAFAGLLVSLHSVGNFISSFFAGILPVYIGRKKSILLFDSAFAISFLLILVGNSPLLLIIAFILTGLARGATSNYCNFEINNLAPGKAWTINVLHAMFSVGAFIFPIIVTLLTKSNPDKWIIAVILLVILGVISWLLYYLIPVEVDVKKKADGGANKAKSESDYGFFKESLFYLTVGTLFFYLCAEQGVIGWLVTYFKDTGLLSGALSQMMSSLMWIMMLVGRLSVAYLSEKFPKEKLLGVMSIGIVVFYVVLVFSHSTVPIVIGVCGFGLSMAGIYPTAVSFNGKLIDKYAFAWSYVLTLASLGSIIMPSVIGAIAENAGLYTGMCSVAIVIVVDMIFITLLRRYIRKTA